MSRSPVIITQVCGGKTPAVKTAVCIEENIIFIKGGRLKIEAYTRYAPKQKGKHEPAEVIINKMIKL